jgi:DNA-directed RNA polymerase subunit RPC12/RpoP
MWNCRCGGEFWYDEEKKVYICSDCGDDFHQGTESYWELINEKETKTASVSAKIPVKETYKPLMSFSELSPVCEVNP